VIEAFVDKYWCDLGLISDSSMGPVCLPASGSFVPLNCVIEMLLLAFLKFGE